jgi:hypothetical protein
MPAGEIALVLDLIDEAFDHKAWHGTNLRGSIRGLGVREAAWRPSPTRHNVWEIVVHCAYWKYAVRRRLTREKRGSFPLEGSNWFQRPESGARQATQWKADVALLGSEHRLLRQAVARLRPTDLSRSVGKTPVAALLTGIAAHDLYHAGQIQLLKRLRTRQ